MQGERQHLMPILVSQDHFLHDLLNVLVGRLNSAIHLRTIRGRIVVLDFEVLTQLFHNFVVEVGSIICIDHFRNTVSTDDLILDKPGNHLLSDVGVESSFYLLGEIINGNEDEPVTIGSSWFDAANHIDAPHSKGPRRCHDIQE